jgi:hypothetical protein
MNRDLDYKVNGSVNIPRDIHLDEVAFRQLCE